MDSLSKLALDYFDTTHSDEKIHVKKTEEYYEDNETRVHNIIEPIVLQQLEAKGVTGIPKVKRDSKDDSARSHSGYITRNTPYPFFYTQFEEDHVNGKNWEEYTFKDTKDKIEKTIKVAEILQAVYENGYLHHDIKPKNLMIDDANNVIVIDFGFASKHKDGVSYTNGRSLYYAAPELKYAPRGSWQKKHGSIYIRADVTTDIYALTVSLTEVLGLDTDILQRESDFESTYGALSDFTKQLAEKVKNGLVKRQLADFILKNLSIEPENRMQTFKEFAESLQEIYQSYEKKP